MCIKLHCHKYSIYYIDGAFSFNANLNDHIFDRLPRNNKYRNWLFTWRWSTHLWSNCWPLHSCTCLKNQKSYFSWNSIRLHRGSENNSISCADINFTYSFESFLIATFIYIKWRRMDSRYSRVDKNGRHFHRITSFVKREVYEKSKRKYCRWSLVIWG